MIKKITVGALSTNCYIVYDEENKEAMVIDPGYEDEEIMNYIESEQLNVKYIYLTHCHFDHIQGVGWLKGKTKAQIISFDTEEENLKDENINLSRMIFGQGFSLACDRILFENDEIQVGKYNFRVIHTPGHTSGSTCLYDGNNLFSGDTIFSDTYGRVDFPTGNPIDMIKSIKNKLLLLPPETVVYPGHGQNTTIQKFSQIEM